MNWRAAFTICGLGIAFLLLSGCGTVYLHSNARQKQGEDAAKAWGEVDLSATFKTERDNLNKLLDAELQTQDRLALTVRNAELRKMLASSGPLPVHKAMSDRLAALVGPSGTTTAWSTARTKLNGNARDQRELREQQALLQAPDVSCRDLMKESSPELSASWRKWAAAKPDNKPSSEIVLAKLRPLCREEPQLRKNLETALRASGGRIEVAVGELAELREAIELARESRTKVQEAIEEHEEALAAATRETDKQTAAGKVAQTAKKLKDALEAAAAAQDAFSKEIVAKEKVAKLEKALVAIASNTTGTPPEGATDAVIVAILLPRILDDARAISRAGGVPETLPLLIRLNLERLRLEAATREVKSLEAQAELSQAIVESLMEQAAQLEQELKFLDNSPAKSLAGGGLLDAFSEAEKLNGSAPKRREGGAVPRGDPGTSTRSAGSTPDTTASSICALPRCTSNRYRARKSTPPNGRR